MLPSRTERTEFYDAVERRASLGGQNDAEDATRAAPSALVERLSDDQGRDLAARLPGDLRSPLTDGESG